MSDEHIKDRAADIVKKNDTLSNELKGVLISAIRGDNGLNVSKNVIDQTDIGNPLQPLAEKLQQAQAPPAAVPGGAPARKYK
ncbi:hypothetical protein SAMD00019534_078580 [Acytostelium subglobosum LB1]|uniref:hypothetical protein n=1 Tax=Acytostelium subglobosum LB1 TaxID=1410327 RepID=UPI000644AC02|nr:hypothetical protein SAMD00019534_078580 [Acytostelium subglobosum LB1]GAM24683.1 hypothetical protein SAMD00019534_078580 [Acytostelium subglobosum LB1]|eukprot:XP_012752352.1 hypothetical protein SAMD00019534_078580 [Acytostelium subglobosum LB1]